MKFRFVPVVVVPVVPAMLVVLVVPVVLVMMAVLSAFAAQETASAQQAQSVWDGIYTEEQAARGEPLYAEECASCHGPDLLGGEMAPSLADGEFLWAWNGLSVGELFERLRTSMPEGDPRSVSRRQKADILAFMLFANEFPAGEKELASRTEMLNQIKFEAVKQ